MDGIVTNAENIISQINNGIIPVSIFYIGLNALITLILAILVVKARVQTKTIIGDGGKERRRRICAADEGIDDDGRDRDAEDDESVAQG